MTGVAWQIQNGCQGRNLNPFGYVPFMASHTGQGLADVPDRSTFTPKTKSNDCQR